MYISILLVLSLFFGMSQKFLILILHICPQILSFLLDVVGLNLQT